MPKIKDLTGVVFGRLTVLETSGKCEYGRYLWKCECECGNLSIVRSGNLVKGITTSCGCFRREQRVKALTIHGQATVKIRTPEFTAWSQMRERCNNKNTVCYKNYGGRGIAYCKRWEKFENFYADMGKKPSPRHSLDRFPNRDGDYKPSNCRWATPKQQNGNRRSNRWIEYNGRKKILADWATELGVTHSHIRQMLKTKPFSQVYNFYKDKQTNK